MPVFHRLKLIFIHIPKNAGTSVIQALTEANGGEPVYIGHPTWSHYAWPHYAQKFPTEWASYHKIAVIRHPVDRVVSCYRYARMLRSHWHSPDGSTVWGVHQDYERCKDATIDQCCQLLASGQLKHPTWLRQTPFIYDADRCMVDMVLRYEHLDSDFRLLCQVCRLPDVKLPAVNVSQGDATACSDESHGVIREVYQKDFDLLGY